MAVGLYAPREGEKHVVANLYRVLAKPWCATLQTSVNSGLLCSLSSSRTLKGESVGSCTLITRVVQSKNCGSQRPLKKLMLKILGNLGIKTFIDDCEGFPIQKLS